MLTQIAGALALMLVCLMAVNLIAAHRHLRSFTGRRERGFLLFSLNDNITVEALQNKLLALNESAKSLQAKADAENRELTDEERKELESIFASFEACSADIERRQKIADQEARLGTPQRVTLDADLAAARATPPAAAADTRAANAAARDPRSLPRVQAIDNRGAWGWRSMGEFARAVRNAAMPGGHNSIDPRLVSSAATTYSQEGVGQDGGFAVPPDFRSEIMKKVFGEESLLARTDQQTSSSNGFTVPKDETTPWQTSGGVQAYWDSEAGTITQSKVQLGSTTVKLDKLTALVPVTEELLMDANSLASYLRSKAPEKMDFKVTDAIVNGNGNGQPLGIMNSGAKVTADPESGQAAATLRAENIVKMYSRLYAGCRRNAIWLINQDIEPQLLTMTFPGTGTAVPVYLPPGGLSAAPYGMLMGRPVIPTEACQTLGTEGDIILTDLSKYLSVVKAGGMRQDVSIHLWFDQDVTAFRFILRVGGQPWWSSAISPKNGSSTRSCIVTLGAR